MTSDRERVLIQQYDTAHRAYLEALEVVREDVFGNHEAAAASAKSQVEKAKRAREQREVDKEAYDEERRMLDRDREQLAFDEHQKREDEFQLEHRAVARRAEQHGLRLQSDRRLAPLQDLLDDVARLVGFVGDGVGKAVGLKVSPSQVG